MQHTKCNQNSNKEYGLVMQFAKQDHIYNNVTLGYFTTTALTGFKPEGTVWTSMPSVSYK
jgi:hypothetical protein